MTKVARTLICGDLHIPYHDPTAVAAFLDFANDYQPHHMVVLGDVVDVEALSRFLKDPREAANPQEEFNRGREFLWNLMKITPKTQHYHFIVGNHEERLQKYLLRNASPLLQLRALSIEVQLGVEGRWNVVKYGRHLRIDDLIVLHGTSYGSNVNDKNITKYGGLNIVQGHSHRLSQRYVRSVHGLHSAAEAGCLCDLEPSYTHLPNWAQGFVTHEGGQLRTHLIMKGKVQ